MNRIIGAVVVACVVVVGMSSDASAGHHSHSRSHSHNHRSSGYVQFNFGGYGGGYHCQPAPRVYHNTSHYDYHPTEVYRHRDHYHVVPGHYDYHQTGHWHR